ncbi:MAG: HDOD domain-containing protein [Desulfobulbaceae bacterium]|nr:HDOD domain-containing protein [Desulfobulbaceae bacterium]HIJ77741.1 HDOD domain-containing protein [Deltaproteobacteria bacterium]
MPTAKTPHHIFIARQPIFKRNMRVFAYELLFRSGLANFFDPRQDGEEASSKVITNSFLLIGIAKVTGGKKAFINFTEDMVLSGYPTLFPNRDAVIEILEDVRVTEEVVAACRELVAQGYVLALDDFLYDDHFIPLLKIAKIVKFDIRQMSFAELKRQVKIVKQYKVKLLAEKIETFEEFEAVKELGFDLFQGYFFSKPKIVEGRDIPGSKLHYLQVLRLIGDENFDFSKLGELIARDVSLAYKLLKYVNSAYFARMHEVESLTSAVAMLGELNLRKWLALMMLSYLADDKPSELLRLATLRGSFCELIAVRLLRRGRDAALFHTAGMFSLLPAMLDKPMADIIGELALAPLVKEALLGRGVNPIFQALCLVKAYERGEWEPVLTLVNALGVKLDDLPPLYEAALETLLLFDFTD